ncbi:hypothetical protein IWW34DRAFT_581921, partial [Fusarium oxysporum f. sp. albedinis]
YVWHNINKVTTGFELIRARRALWWSRRELPQLAGLLRVYYGLGFSQTLEQCGYCWIEPRIDWNLLRFPPDITGSVLFGNGTLHQRF